MSLIYMYALAISAVLVSVTGCFFSVTGLMSLFAGASTSVAIMAASLEFSKFIVVGFLYRYWGHVHKPLRAYLVFSVVILMVITSTGIYGYLSNGYQVASVEIHSNLLEIKSLEGENARVQNQIAEFRKFIDQIPNSRISRKFEFQKEYEPRIQDLRDQSELIQKKIDQKRTQLLTMNSKVGPVVFLAEALGTDIDTVVKYLILIFVSVFDPLAVSLVFCLNMIIRLREKYRNNEYKIGARSLTSPVDHRYKRAA